MSQAEKALAKLMSGQSDRNFTFAELTGILAREGFIHDGGRGSHQVWRHADGRKVVLPRHGNTIKPIYVKTVRQLLQQP